MNQKLALFKERYPQAYLVGVFAARIGAISGILWIFVNSPDIIRYFMERFSE